MDQPESGEITHLLHRVQSGDSEAEASLAAVVYDELKRISARHMRRERAGHTLQTTALVNEAYLRMVNQKNSDWKSRAHFFGVASQLMRRILVDHARTKLAEKRGGGVIPMPLDEGLVFSNERCSQLVDLDEALKKLEIQDRRVCQVIEMRFFAGLSIDETAEALKISARTVKRDWSFGRAWLRAELESA